MPLPTELFKFAKRKDFVELEIWKKIVEDGYASTLKHSECKTLIAAIILAVEKSRNSYFKTIAGDVVPALILNDGQKIKKALINHTTKNELKNKLEQIFKDDADTNDTDYQYFFLSLSCIAEKLKSLQPLPIDKIESDEFVRFLSEYDVFKPYIDKILSTKDDSVEGKREEEKKETLARSDLTSSSRRGLSMLRNAEPRREEKQLTECAADNPLLKSVRIPSTKQIPTDAPQQPGETIVDDKKIPLRKIKKIKEDKEKLRREEFEKINHVLKVETLELPDQVHRFVMLSDKIKKLIPTFNATIARKLVKNLMQEEKYKSYTRFMFLTTIELNFRCKIEKEAFKFPKAIDLSWTVYTNEEPNTLVFIPNMDK